MSTVENQEETFHKVGGDWTTGQNTLNKDITLTWEEFDQAVKDLEAQPQEVVLLVCDGHWKERAKFLFQHLSPKNHDTDKKPIKASEVCILSIPTANDLMPKGLRQSANNFFDRRTKMSGSFVKTHENKKYPENRTEFVSGSIVQIGKKFVRQPLLLGTCSIYDIQALDKHKTDNWKITLLIQDGTNKVIVCKTIEELIQKAEF